MKSGLIVLVVMLSLFSCRRIETTSGPVVTELRTQPYFNEIVVLGNINVFYVNDNSFQIKVEAGERIIQYVQTVVSNNQLIIKELNNSVANHRPINVYVRADSLNSVSLEGSGNFTSNSVQLSVQHLELKLKGSGNISIPTTTYLLKSSIEGSGNISINGSTNKNLVSIKGSGDFKSRYLTSSISSVAIEGSGKAVVTVMDTLNAVILGSGCVEYYGMPTVVNSQITGSGTVVPKN